jgi:hypothetical protein
MVATVSSMGIAMTVTVTFYPEATRQGREGQQDDRQFQQK